MCPMVQMSCLRYVPKTDWNPGKKLNLFEYCTTLVDHFDLLTHLRASRLNGIYETAFKQSDCIWAIEFFVSLVVDLPAGPRQARSWGGLSLHKNPPVRCLCVSSFPPSASGRPWARRSHWCCWTPERGTILQSEDKLRVDFKHGFCTSKVFLS